MCEFMFLRNFDGFPSVKLSKVPIISAPVCVICSSCEKSFVLSKIPLNQSCAVFAVQKTQPMK